MNLMVKCVNSHDLCYQGGPCPYCEPVYPFRDESGKFVKIESSDQHEVQTYKKESKVR
jgi:hypothetical protein